MSDKYSLKKDRYDDDDDDYEDVSRIIVLIIAGVAAIVFLWSNVEDILDRPSVSDYHEVGVIELKPFDYHTRQFSRVKRYYVDYISPDTEYDFSSRVSGRSEAKELIREQVMREKKVFETDSGRYVVLGKNSSLKSFLADENKDNILMIVLCSLGAILMFGVAIYYTIRYLKDEGYIKKR
ncbi:MAG: hypothetical protein ATN31_04160 [Candidatus Epulonipiscioides saccharophilum]|nr:MAG: hypothetical protein ATN31_04160 [Epulopiscium sp. AS2M-Bin001]